MPATASVTFRVRCAETRPGEAVFVAGNADALGRWAADAALPLATSAQEYPVWVAGPVELPAGAPIEFKFLVRREDAAGPPRWEGLDGNRAATFPGGTVAADVFTWGEAQAASTAALAAAPAQAPAVATPAVAAAAPAAPPRTSPTAVQAAAQTRSAALRLWLPADRPGRPVVCGEGPGLGAWQPAEAPAMARAGGTGGGREWVLPEAPPGVGPGAAFKYVILDDGGGPPAWEDGRGNRSWPAEPAVHRFGASSPRRAATGAELEVQWGGPELAAWQPDAVPSSMLHAFHWPFGEVRKRAGEIAAHGFSAVQISPAQRSVQGDQWWTRYQPARYEDIDGLGNEEDLRRACEACAGAGLRVFGDLVFNHMQVVASCDEWRRAQHDHGHLEHLKRRLSERFGPTFNRGDFQWPWFPLEGDEWDGPNRMEGWGCGEWSELRGGSPKVVAVHAAHVEALKRCGVSGFRFDAAKHMRPEHIGEYVRRAGTFAYGEVLSVDPAMHNEYMAVGTSNSALPFPTTDFLLGVWLRNFLERGEDAVDFDVGPWVRHLLDVEMKRGGHPPPRAGGPQRGRLVAPLLARNSVRFARNHDTVCNDVPFYGLGGWGQRGAAEVASAWLLAAHDGTVLLLSDDVAQSPLLRRALLYRQALRKRIDALRAEDRVRVETLVRARRAEGGGPPAVVCLACRVGRGGRLLGLCALNPDGRAPALFEGSGALAAPAGAAAGAPLGLQGAAGSDGATVRGDGQLEEPVLLAPHDGAFLLAEAA